MWMVVVATRWRRRLFAEDSVNQLHLMALSYRNPPRRW